MSIDALLAGAGFAATLVTAILAIVAMDVEIPGKGKVASLKRRYALFGAVGTALFGAVTLGLQVRKLRDDQADAERRRQEEAARTNALLFNISRAVYPLRDLYVVASATVPLDARPLASYRKRLSAGADAYVRTHRNAGKQDPGTWLSMLTDSDGKERPIGVFLVPGAPLFPNRRREPVAFRALGDFGLDVTVYRTPLSRAVANRHGLGDLEFRVEADTAQLEYLVGDSVVRVEGGRLIAARSSWRSFTGKIESLPDLSGAEMIISFKDEDTGDDAVDLPYLELEKGMRLETVELQVMGHRLALQDLHLIRGQTYPEYVCVLPLHVEEIAVTVHCGDESR